MTNQNVTRGNGLLEGILSRRRTKLANSLISNKYRKGRILDIGCGSYPYFLNHTIFVEKIGIDQLLVGKQKNVKNNEITIVNVDIEKDSQLPFSSNYFDVITMLAVFEHIEPEHLKKVVKEIHRVLKPGGGYILTTPPKWTNELLKYISIIGLVSKEEIEEHKKIYSPAEIKTVLTNAEFKQNSIEVGYFEMGMNIWARAIK